MQPQPYNYQQGQNQAQQQYSTLQAGNMPNPAFAQNAVYPTSVPHTIYVPYVYMPPNMPQNMQQNIPQNQNMQQTIGGYTVTYTPTYSNEQEPTNQQLNSYPSPTTLRPLPEPMIETEARKIHIGNLPHQFKAEDLKKHIATHATTPPGLDDNAVEKLELPVLHDASARRRKGHAFATFKDCAMAMTCIQALNGTVFKGKKLEMRL